MVNGSSTLLRHSGGMIARIASLLCAALLLAAAPGLGPVRAAEALAKGSTSTSHYLPFPGVTASVMVSGVRRGVLAMDASLDVPSDALRVRAQQMNPRLRAAYAQSLMIYAAGIPPGRPLDPDYLSREMQRQTDQVLGTAGAKFLIGTILIN